MTWVLPSTSTRRQEAQTAHAPPPSAWDVWQCHGSRAGRMGCVAVPRICRETRGMCGSATFLAQGTPDVRQCHVSRAGDVGCVAVPRFSRASLAARGLARARPIRGSLPRRASEWTAARPRGWSPAQRRGSRGAWRLAPRCRLRARRRGRRCRCRLRRSCRWP